MSAANHPDPILRCRPFKNATCPYCNARLDQQTRTKEHVIGRRFVPVGTLNNNWNLILWACMKCNRHKSDLEDDIAAISMHFHTAGLPNMADELARAEAKRRGVKSGSRTTGRSVARSGVEVKGSAKLGTAAEITFSFNGPPQFDDKRVYELARLQMMGFFYFLTYDKTKEAGHFWTGGFYPIHGAIKTDWGNTIHRSFMQQCNSWDYRLLLTTAEGYYRAAIRRHPTLECWSWAVQWNDCYRLVGYFGDFEAAKMLASSLPQVEVKSIVEATNGWIRHRVEQPLAEHEDTLFSAGGAAEA